MTIIERANYAKELKTTGKCNCAQAVINALYDLTDLDLNTLMASTSGFAVGMGTMEATCGALIGANIILGLLVKNRTVKYSKILLNKFKELSKATICKVIKGVETGTVLTACDMCCYNAVIAFFDTLAVINQ